MFKEKNSIFLQGRRVFAFMDWDGYTNSMSSHKVLETTWPFVMSSYPHHDLAKTHMERKSLSKGQIWF